MSDLRPKSIGNVERTHEQFQLTELKGFGVFSGCISSLEACESLSVTVASQVQSVKTIKGHVISLLLSPRLNMSEFNNDMTA